MLLGSMVASGFAGLGYQIVWTQQSALWLGHESAAVLAVMAAFFGGLALGAFAMGPRIEASRHPLRWYAACELSIAAWSVVLLWLMSPASGWLLGLTGVQPQPVWQWSVAFAGTFLLLLPSTAAMGATLPAMERITTHLQAQLRAHGRSIAALYASNTFGAFAGVLAAAFWLVPQLGLARTALICIALNVACAAAAWGVSKETSETTPWPEAPAAAGGARDRRRRLAILGLTGLLGIAYEVLVVRVLSQVTEDTVYTYAWLLAVYLAGSALGAAAYSRWLAPRADVDRRSDRLGDRLYAALAAACLIGTGGLWLSERIRDALLERWGGGVGSAIGIEAALALVAFGLPTLVMGALFCHLSDRAQQVGVSFGRSLGVNTLGAAVAPLLVGVWAAPALGSGWSLLMVAGGYLALASRAAWRRPVVWAPAAAALALAVWAPPLAFVEVPEGGHVVSYREGAMASVSVVEDAAGVSRLRINNRQQEGSSATRLVDGRQGLLPVLLHPAPRRVLFLGLGTGITAASATRDPAVQVDAVELLPEVIEASRHFTDAFDAGVPGSRMRLLAGDARRYVRVSKQMYDVIVSDNFHPARSGSGSLYTVEHFRAVQQRLANGGVFCQWLPLHQLDLETLRSIVQSFVAVYPGGWAILANNSLRTPVLGLVGRAGESRFDLAQVRERVAGAALANGLAGVGIEDEFAVLGSFVAGPDALARLSGDAPANTDDRPVVAYRAPRVTYAPDSLPQETLSALLHELSIRPSEVLGARADIGFSKRLAAYWAARDRFVELGRGVRPSADVSVMLAQVRDPLLSVLRISPDFRPAYDPLLNLATSLARIDAAGSQALLTELARTQPARQEAVMP